MKTYLCAFLGSALATLAWTPLAIRLARRFQLLDRPGVRKVHTASVPRAGGAAIAVPFFVMAGAVCLLDNAIGRAFRQECLGIATVMAGCIAMLLVGLVDDVRGLRARTKLLAQMLAAAAVCAAGVRIDSIGVEGLFTVELGLWAWPLSVLWITGMTNAVNLIDGLDGLAAGIAAITMAVVAVIALSIGQPIMAVLTLICLGTLLGFLAFNFHPARIFLGDSGTYFLGFLLGAGSLLTSTKTGTLVGLALPLVAMGVPIFDTLFAILRRALERRPLFAPDRSHIHHRLVDLGLTHRKAVLLLYGLTLILTSFGLFMMMARDLESVVILGCLGVLLVVAFRFFGAVRLHETLDALRRRRAIAREVHGERAVFEEADLQLRDAATVENWWRSLCLAAESYDFEHLSMVLSRPDGTEERRSWQRKNGDGDSRPCTAFSIPVVDGRSGLPVEIDAAVLVNGSVESVGRRVALFSRLVETGARSAAGDNGSA